MTVNGRKTRLAVVVSHPIQYYAPWFVHLASVPEVELRVFYLWDFGVKGHRDPTFGIEVKWDIPLLDGYEHQFVPNVSRDPGTHHPRGLDNPSLVSAVAAWRPDVILLFGYPYVSHLRLLCSSKLRSIPVILRGDSHDLGRNSSLAGGIAHAVRTLLFRRVSAYLAVGEANRRYFARYARHSDEIHFAGHFVDNARFRAAGAVVKEEARRWRQSLGISPNAVLFGFVGKMEAKKCPMHLLEAFLARGIALTPAASPSVSILFAGAGELEGELRARAAKSGTNQVFFAPFQNQSKMPTVYAALDYLVLPSSWNETWGLSVNEAMNLGVPAIVSDMVGCALDLVTSGETGWVYPARDVVALQAAMQAAIDLLPEQRAAMRINVLRRVEAYSVENASRGLLVAVEWVLNRKAAMQ